jgi:hypothetical protein
MFLGFVVETEGRFVLAYPLKVATFSYMDKEMKYIIGLYVSCFVFIL